MALLWNSSQLFTLFAMVVACLISSCLEALKLREVTALTDFMKGANFVNDNNNGNFCKLSYINCSSSHVLEIMMQNLQLNGFISPSLGNLPHLHKIRLDGNHLHGSIPQSLTTLKGLVLLNLSGNPLSPPFPHFDKSVHVIISMPLAIPPTTHLHVLTFVILGICATFVLAICVWGIYTKYMSNLVLSNEGPTTMSLPMVEAITTESSPGRVVGQGNTSIVPTTTSSPMTETLIVDFSPEYLIGQGSTSIVYKGHSMDGRITAVKKMHASNQLQNEAAFVAELNVLSKVEHPNIIKFFGHRREGVEMVLALEYLPMGPLSNLLFRWNILHINPLPWESRLQIANDIANGLQYLHTLRPFPIAHMDVKSENILLDNDFHAKLSDFGRSKFVHGEVVEVEVGTGSRGYAPPDLLERRCNTKADVYSFGVVLMELITGKPAYDSARPTEARLLCPFFRGIHASGSQLLLLDIADRSLNFSLENAKSISIVADLAQECTQDQEEERPSMLEILETLSTLI